MAPTSHEEGRSPLVRMEAMQGSAGQESYADNSSSQNYRFHTVAKPRLAIALKHVVDNINHPRAASVEAESGHDRLITPRQRPHIAIADLGCSHGRNTLDCTEFVLHTLQQNWLSGEDDIVIDTANQHRTGKEDDMKIQHVPDGTESEDNKEIRQLRSSGDMEIQYFFSDLPSNDFNALFQSLQPYLYQSNGVCTGGDNYRVLPKIFAAGVPGSFYGRLFPSASLHLVICSLSLHWLSQVPPSVFDRSSLAWNGEHTWINKASVSVEHAYAQQSILDMKSFLKCRANELAHGGVMFLFILARAPKRDCLSSNHDFIPLQATWELFDYAFKEMVDEGLLSLEEMEIFNLPLYMLNQEELECVLLDIPELDVLHMETMENVAFFPEQKDRMLAVHQWTRMVSSVMRPFLEAQLGTYKADEVLKRLKSIANKSNFFDVTITISLIIAHLQCRRS